MNQQNRGTKSSDALKDLVQYLIQWRLSLWQSIRHKETIVWSFVAFYVAAIGIIVGAIQYIDVPLYAGVLVIVILTTWGIMVVMDAAIWYARNIFTISRIEKLFVRNGAGQLIPKSYLDPKFRYQDIYVVHIFFYTIVALLAYSRYAIGLFGYDRLSQLSESGPFLLVTIVTISGFYLIWKWERHLILERYFANFRDEFSIDVNGKELKPVPQEEKNESILKSPGWISCTWVISTVTAFAISIIGLNLLKDFPEIFITFVVIWFLAGFTAVVLWWRKKLPYKMGHRVIKIFLFVSVILCIICFIIFVGINFSTQFHPKHLIAFYFQ